MGCRPARRFACRSRRRNPQKNESFSAVMRLRRSVARSVTPPVDMRCERAVLVCRTGSHLHPAVSMIRHAGLYRMETAAGGQPDRVRSLQPLCILKGEVYELIKTAPEGCFVQRPPETGSGAQPDPLKALASPAFAARGVTAAFIENSGRTARRLRRGLAAVFTGLSGFPPRAPSSGQPRPGCRQ